MNDVKVIITKNIAAGTDGFGIPLLLAIGQISEITFTVCPDLDSVKALFAIDTEMYKAAELIFMQDNAPRKIAVYSSTSTVEEALGKVFDEDWRQLVIIDGIENDEDSLKIAKYIEGKKNKLYFKDIRSKTGLDNFKMLERTIAFYYPEANEIKNPVCALVGATSGKRLGSFTYKNQKLKGLTPVKTTDSEILSLHESGAFTVLKKAGDVVSSEGITTNGEYIDIVDARDYIITEIEYRIQKLLNQVDKIPYDNTGISMLESVVTSVLQEAFLNKLVAINDKNLPDFSVNFAKRSETLETDRARRQYLGGKFKFGLAGAVHTVEIRGEIIV